MHQSLNLWGFFLQHWDKTCFSTQLSASQLAHMLRVSCQCLTSVLMDDVLLVGDRRLGVHAVAPLTNRGPSLPGEAPVTTSPLPPSQCVMKAEYQKIPELPFKPLQCTFCKSRFSLKAIYPIEHQTTFSRTTKMLVMVRISFRNIPFTWVSSWVPRNQWASLTICCGPNSVC